MNGRPWNLPASFLLGIAAGLLILSVIIAWDDVAIHKYAEKYWADVSITDGINILPGFVYIHLYRSSPGVRELLQPSCLCACIQHSLNIHSMSHCSHWAPKGALRVSIHSKIPKLMLCIKQKVSAPKPGTAAPENTAVEMRVIIGVVFLDWLYWPLWGSWININILKLVLVSQEPVQSCSIPAPFWAKWLSSYFS